MSENNDNFNEHEDVVKAIEETLKSIIALKDIGGNE